MEETQGRRTGIENWNDTPPQKGTGMRIHIREVAGLESAAIASGLPVRTTDYATDWAWAQWAATGRDYERLVRLGRMGGAHDCCLCGVVVWLDITAPRYWWQEFARYHFKETVSATSTMHTLAKVCGALEKDPEAARLHFSPDTDPRAVSALTEAWRAFDAGGRKDMDALKASVPEGLLMRAVVTVNYRQLLTMHRQRRGHGLKCWAYFRRMVGHLPLMDRLLGPELADEAPEASAKRAAKAHATSRGSDPYAAKASPAPRSPVQDAWARARATKASGERRRDKWMRAMAEKLGAEWPDASVMRQAWWLLDDDL